jgi:hypothetical protein
VGDIKYEHIQHEPIAKRLLVVGAPRSGTHFIADVLQGFGMRVKHERMGEDGTVNCAWLAMRQEGDEIITVTGRQNYDFDKIVQLVRHPLECIPSMSKNLTPMFWKWQAAHSDLHIPDPTDLEMVAAFWIFWTDGCLHLADKTIRLEDISNLGKPVGENIGRVKGPIKIEDCGGAAEGVMKRMEVYNYAP